MIHKSTKIIATLGPASDTKEHIQSLYENGMNVARLNFSHGSYEYFEELITTIRSVSSKIAILLDTKGPEIRTGDLEDGNVSLQDNQEITFTNEKVMGTTSRLAINYQHLDQVEVGNTILIDDGLIEARIVGIDGKQLKAKVLNGGVLGSRKTVTIRGHNVDIPFLSDKDKKDIEFGIKHNVDFIAASFVRKAEELEELKKLLKKHSAEHIRIIAKIEHQDAVNNFDEILQYSNGIMIARGDLGVEMPLAQVPKVQEEIIVKCNVAGKPVIVATQMLESMKDNPRPTRAEVSDVAQAILQGTDAVMLSGETASGKYPSRAIKMMSDIAREYDPLVKSKMPTTVFDKLDSFQHPVSTFATKAAFLAAKALNAKAILVPTESGFSARKVSRFKPQTPIFAVTHNETVMRQLQLSWGVYPRVEKFHRSTRNKMVQNLVTRCQEKEQLDNKDLVVITSGHIQGESGHTNMIEIFKVEDILSKN